MSGLSMIMTPSETDSCSSAASTTCAELADQLRVMHRQESTSYVCRDYIDNSDPSRPPSSRRRRRRDAAIDRDDRAKMVDWCFSVSDFCKFQRETVAIGTGYLDRFLATSSPRAQRALRDKKEFQLVAMTCLYLAIKLFEPLAMDAKLLAQISHGCYAEEDIVEMEKEVLRSLEWRVNGPTAHSFIGHLMALLPSSACDEDAAATILDFSRFQAEIAVADYDLSVARPSTVALAAILNSVEGVEETVFPANSRFRFFRLIAEACPGLDPFSTEVNAVRSRLLGVFSANSGYELPQVANLTPVYETEEYYCREPEQTKMSRDHVKVEEMTCSPVSVARHFGARQSA